MFVIHLNRLVMAQLQGSVMPLICRSLLVLYWELLLLASQAFLQHQLLLHQTLEQ